MEFLYFDMTNTAYKCVRCYTIFKKRIDIHNHLNQENKCEIINKKLKYKEYTSEEMDELEGNSYSSFFPEIYEYIEKVDNFDEKENRKICKYCFESFEFIHLLDVHKETCKRKELYKKCKELYILDCDRLGKKNFSDSFDTSHIDEDMMLEITLKGSLLYTFDMIMINDSNHNFYINVKENTYKIYDNEDIEEVSFNIIFVKILYDIYGFYQKCCDHSKTSEKYHPVIIKTLKQTILNEFYSFIKEDNYKPFMDSYDKYNEQIKIFFE